MTLHIFGYTLSIKKDPIQQVKKGSWRVVKGCCKIAEMDEFLVLTDPNGFVLPNQTDLTIISGLDEPMSATCRFFISGVEEEPLRWPREEELKKEEL